MENLDIIVLTIIVVISFVVFIVTSIKEFNNMAEEPYEFEKASGFTRAALFNALSSLLDDDEIPDKNKEKFKSTLKRTISDMETDGVYFDKTKSSPKGNLPANKPDEDKGSGL